MQVGRGSRLQLAPLERSSSLVPLGRSSSHEESRARLLMLMLSALWVAHPVGEKLAGGTFSRLSPAWAEQQSIQQSQRAVGLSYEFKKN